MRTTKFFLHQRLRVGELPIRSSSASMVIVSPTFPPEEMYEMLMSVETPVAKSPFDAHVRDLWSDSACSECARRGQSLLRLSRHEEFLNDLYDVFLFALRR